MAHDPPRSQTSSLHSSTPLLGTAWVEAQLIPSTPAGHERSDAEGSKISHFPSSSVCLDLSEFRRILQRYRKIDDSINLSLNRSFLLPGSLESDQSSQIPWLNQTFDRSYSSVKCAKLWDLLTASWLSREKLIRSCIDIVDRSVQEKRESIKSLSTTLSSEPTLNTSSSSASQPPTSTSKNQQKDLEAKIYTAELMRRMIHDELAVESAIRKQSLQKFKAHCPSSKFTIPRDSPQVELDPHPTFR